MGMPNFFLFKRVNEVKKGMKRDLITPLSNLFELFKKNQVCATDLTWTLLSQSCKASAKLVIDEDRNQAWKLLQLDSAITEFRSKAS